MQKKKYLAAALICLVVVAVILVVYFNKENKPNPPAQITPENTTIVANLPATSSPLQGDCSLVLLLPGLATDDSSLQVGVKAAAEQKGCQLEVYAAQGKPENMVAQINQASQKKVNALIVKPIDHADVEMAIQKTSKAGLPVIVIGAQGLAGIQTNRVVPDFIDGASKAASFLCGAIHEYGNIVQLLDSQIDDKVSKAFSDKIQTTCPGATLISVPLQGSGEEASKKAMLQVLAANPDISAVFAPTESDMNGVVKANQQVGILGVVSAEFGQASEPGSIDLTRSIDAVLRVSGSETGKAAVQAALAQANGAAAAPQIAVAMQLSVADMAFQLPPDPSARRIVIGVILPDGAGPFYQQVYRGMLSPSRALDNITLKIRSGNNDPQKMIRDLDWMVNTRMDAILISPVDEPAFLIAIDKAVRSGIPVVTLGTALAIEKIISQISFDEYAAGYKAGEYLCAALGAKGTLADVYDVANPEKEAVRSRGLQDYQRENCPEVKIITQSLPAGKEPACRGLQKFLSEAGPIAGIFAHSDELGLCAVSASKTALVVGIGASAEAIQSIQAGKLSATLGQYPYEMGLIAMETTIEYLYGQKVEPNKPFPANLITKDSLQ